MNFNKVEKKIKSSDYRYIISLGNKCGTSMVLKRLKKRPRSYPFDYIPTNPELIKKYLIDDSEMFPEYGTDRNQDNVWFGHWPLEPNEAYEKTKEIFVRRMDRFKDTLKSKESILFVYTSEADISNEMFSRDRDNFADLIKLRDFFIDEYSNDNFHMIAVHINKIYQDVEKITNYTINVESKYLSDFPHGKENTRRDVKIGGYYRRQLKWLLAEVFGG